MSAQLRLLSVIEYLSGNEVTGARLCDVAQAVGVIDSTVLRDLETLQSAGWAQKLPDGKWRLAARPIQLLINFQSGLARAKERVHEVEHNYTRVPAETRPIPSKREFNEVFKTLCFGE